MVGGGPLPPAGLELVPVAEVRPAAELPKNVIGAGSDTRLLVDVEPLPTVEPAGPDPT
jgi:hypothetical protein